MPQVVSASHSEVHEGGTCGICLGLVGGSLLRVVGYMGLVLRTWGFVFGDLCSRVKGAMGLRPRSGPWASNPKPSQTEALDHDTPPRSLSLEPSESSMSPGRLGETVVHDILHSVAEKEASWV